VLQFRHLCGRVIISIFPFRSNLDFRPVFQVFPDTVISMTSKSQFDLFLLERLPLADSSQRFLDDALSQLTDSYPVKAAAVVRSHPPEWVVIGCAGIASKSVPRELAADAVDSGRIARQESWMALPIGEKQALVVQSEIDEHQLKQLGNSLAAALVTVENQQNRSRQVLRLRKILEITHAWRQTSDMESLLQAMAEAATELLVADRASIFLWDKNNHMLVARPALGLKHEELQFPDDTGIVGQVVQTRQPRRVGGGMDEDQIARTIDQKTGYHTKTLLCVPLIAPDGQCVGAFEVLNKRDGVFTEDDEEALTELATHAAVALEGTKHLEELLHKHQRLVAEAAEGLQLIGESPAIDAVRSTIRRIADTDLAILILGKNGTGKEVVARSIHYLSRRKEQPFIAVNCASLTETLLESELFGHEKGAFTDAHEARAGKFELASGGTLFLDEIGDMSLSGQAKLLRVLEDKIVVRVGGSQSIHAEVRILAATNQDLGQMVREKKFREDLFFRLNVVSLELPPLCERGDDVLLLSKHFLENFCRNMGRKTPEFSPAARKRLLDHNWPGNIRELRNLMERLAYLTSGDRIEADDLAFIDAGASRDSLQLNMNSTLSDATKGFQQKYIQQMIETQKGNMSKAAKRLGLHRSNLYRKMRQLEMHVGEEESTEDSGQ